MRLPEHSKSAIAVAALLLVAIGAVRADEAPIAAAPTEPTPRPIVRDPQPVGPAATGAEPSSDGTPPLDLGARVIKQAIADSRDPLDDVGAPPGAAFGGSGPAGAEKIDRAFKQAEIPTCMTPEAYKFDPPQIGFVGLGGFLALPYLVHAIATGKCRH